METPISGTAPTREILIANLNAKMLREQNLIMALVAGAGAALIGALVWMGITIATQMHLGIVAIGVGAGVGYAVRYAGKGVEKIYGVIAAVFTLLSCMAGEVFSVIQVAATSRHIEFFDALSRVNFAKLLPAIVENTGIITYAIYGFGIYQAYKFAFRQLTHEEIQEAGLGATPATPPTA